MLLLFETAAGFALFKVLDEGKLSKVEVIIFKFSSLHKAVSFMSVFTHYVGMYVYCIRMICKVYIFPP